MDGHTFLMKKVGWWKQKPVRETMGLKIGQECGLYEVWKEHLIVLQFPG